MHIRISRGRYNPGTEAELVRIVEEMQVPALRNLPGFQRYRGGVIRGSGMIIAVSQWDTEEHANFPREALAGSVPAMMALGVTLEPAEVYEVLVDV